jgi:hypothetical protein
MWNPIKAWKRRRYLPGRKYGRVGVTGVFALIALVVILIAGWLIDRRSTNEDEAAVVELARGAEEDVLNAIAEAARAHRIVILSDIHASAAPKRLAARAIEKIVATSGLDIVALEVDADMQPVIDQYLEVAPEDASILVTNGRALREPGPATRDYLEIYRAVWKQNEKLGADQRIQIVAADLGGWPPARPISPAERARKSAEREAVMQKRIQDRVSLNPRARVLVFMTGFHALKSGTGELQTGGSTPVQIAWLGSRLNSAAPEEVYSFLVDAPASGSTTDVTTYAGTRIQSILQRNGVNRTFVTRMTPELNAIDEPLILRKTPGLSFDISPRDIRLGDIADAYIHLK